MTASRNDATPQQKDREGPEYRRHERGEALLPPPPPSPTGVGAILKRNPVALQQGRGLCLIPPADGRKHRGQLGEVERPRQQLGHARSGLLLGEAARRGCRRPNLSSPKRSKRSDKDGTQAISDERGEGGMGRWRYGWSEYGRIPAYEYTAEQQRQQQRQQQRRRQMRVQEGSHSCGGLRTWYHTNYKLKYTEYLRNTNCKLFLLGNKIYGVLEKPGGPA